MHKGKKKENIQVTQLIIMGLDPMASEKEAAGGGISTNYSDPETSKSGIEKLEMIADPDDGLSEEEKAKIVCH